jgi:hypothetical protein
MVRQRELKERRGWQVVQAEPDRFIGLLFRDSEAYRLALKLYAGRYEVIANKDNADILREVIEEHMREHATPKMMRHKNKQANERGAA